MATLLQIDTATEHASVCLTRDGIVLGLIESTEQKNHAAFLQPAIATLMENAEISLHEISAVAVTIGPGSYTGLRVGLASAKGICFALNKPLVTIHTLQVMAQAAADEYRKVHTDPDSPVVFCPLIDARRMEVFTAVYDLSLNELIAPYALVIGDRPFASIYSEQPVVFSGSGSAKLENLLQNPSVSYSKVQHNAAHMTWLAAKLYHSAVFSDLAYSEPLYVKAFFDPSRPNG